MNSKRLFIAIELPLVVRQELARVIQKLQSSGVIQARFVAIDNLHITLSFLGEYPEEHIGILSERLATVVHAPFSARLGAIDFFSRNNRVSVIFAHIIAPECIALAQKVTEVLSDSIVPEGRPFVPHVTLARVKKVLDNDALMEFISSYRMKEYPFRVDSFVLKESIFDANGVRHAPVEQFSL